MKTEVSYGVTLRDPGWLDGCFGLLLLVVLVVSSVSLIHAFRVRRECRVAHDSKQIGLYRRLRSRLQQLAILAGFATVLYQLHEIAYVLGPDYLVTNMAEDRLEQFAFQVVFRCLRMMHIGFCISAACWIGSVVLGFLDPESDGGSDR